MGNLAGWPYWKVISLTGQAGAGTDYQVKFEIGDSAGGNVHLEGHCTNFPQDIRITDDDGTTLLDHFVEDLTADPIVVHVEVKDDLGSNQDIRVYYGKSGETTASNGANTFIQWHGSTSSNFIDSLVIDSTKFIYEAKAKATVNAANNIYFGVSTVANPWQGDSLWIDNYRVTPATRLGTANNGVSTSNEYAFEWILDTWYRLKIIKQAGTTSGYIDNNLIGTSTTNLPDTDLGLFFTEYDTSQGAQEWSFVRKYNSPEPAFSSAGAEQTPGAPTAVFYGPLVGPFGGPI